MTDPYQNVRTYRDLIRANIAFLKGKLKRSPYHLGPIDAETLPLMESLVQINKYGFISIEGQPASHEIEYIPETKKYLEIRQKPYILGFMLKTKVANFEDFMKSQHGYDYRIYEFKRPSGTNQIRAHYLSGFTREHVSTQTRQATTRAGLKNAKWKSVTKTHALSKGYDPPFVFHKYPNLVKLLIPRTVFVVVDGKTYNRGSVENLLLDFFNKEP